MRMASANLMMMNTTPIHILLLMVIADKVDEVRLDHALFSGVSSRKWFTYEIIRSACRTLEQMTLQEQLEEDKAEDDPAGNSAAPKESAGDGTDNADDVWEEALASVPAAPEAEDADSAPAVEMARLLIDGWIIISCPREDWVMLAVRFQAAKDSCRF